MATYVMAQRISDGEWLHMELPVEQLEVTPEVLSGPQVITGVFGVELADLRDLGLQAWGTWIHVEEEGLIRASGILQPSKINEHEEMTFEALGPSCYPKGQVYVDSFTLSGTDPASGESGVGVGLDPADIVRDIWAKLQSRPDGDLGVTVVGDTGVTVGVPGELVEFTTGEGELVSFIAGPYSALDWWEAPDCGSEIDALARDTPFDYVERQQWNADKTDVEHWIEIGWPRVGTRLEDVRFVHDQNMIEAPGPEEPDDWYASEVLVLGKGEGVTRVRGYAGQPYPGRQRRIVAVEDKTLDTVTAANARARVEWAARQSLTEIPEVLVPARHLNATLGTYRAGDDVLVEVEVPWLGTLRLFHRVLEYTYIPGGEVVRVKLRATSSFTNG